MKLQISALKAALSISFLLTAFFVSGQEFSLNGDWAFKTDPYQLGLKEKWYTPGFQTSGWDEMAVPGNWDLPVSGRTKSA